MNIIKTSNIDFYYLVKKEEIDYVMSLLNGPIKYIAIDTETTPDVINWGNEAKALIAKTSLVRLIQLKIDLYNYPIVIDVFKIGKENITPLLQRLYQLHLSKVELIAHNSSYEYMMFKSNWDISFINIKDSMTALATLAVSIGWKSLQNRGFGLKDLAKDLFNVSIDKSQQTSDWSLPELDVEQLQYAALDVGAPRNTFNLYNKQPTESIIIEAYKSIKDVNFNNFNQGSSFHLDQKVIPYLAECEYHGLYVNIPLLLSIIKKSKALKDKALMDICNDLNISLETKLSLNPITKEFEVDIVIPPQVINIINSDKKLLERANSFLETKGIHLNNLQSSYLNKVISNIDNDNEEYIDEKIEIPSILRSIIDYKLYRKLETDASKYQSISSLTGCVHRPIRSVGSSTGRMSARGTEDEDDKANLQAVSTKKIVFDIAICDLFQDPSLGNQMVKLKGSLRNIFIAPKGYTWVSIDYASQELRILGAILAGRYNDDSILNVYLQEQNTPFLINPINGESYENPNTDLHLQAALALNPALSKLELWELKKAAKGGLDGTDYRQMGKIINFSIVYGKGVQGFASEFNVSLGEAEDVLNRYYTKFPGMQAWMEQTSAFALIESTVKNLYGRSIYVAESNAKGLGGSNAIKRKAPNAVIQGTASDMVKLAVSYISNDNDIDICSSGKVIAHPVVHDEINCLIKGNWYLKSHYIDNDGFIQFELDFDTHCIDIAKKLTLHMEQAEKDILNPISGVDFPCKAEANLAFYWKH